MRVMIKFALPVGDSNEAVRSGTLHTVFQQLVEDLEPEAGYFGGERGGFFIVDMQESSQIAELWPEVGDGVTG